MWRARFGLAMFVVLAACGGDEHVAPDAMSTSVDGAPPLDAELEPSGWTTIAAGGQFACAISDVQTLYCWGRIPGAGLIATRIGDARDWSAIAAGSAHACGLRDDRLYCWGRNYDGESGQPASESIEEPTELIPGSTWSQVWAGARLGCGLRADGALWCWGDDAAPSIVETPAPVAAVAFGNAHRCVLDQSSVLTCTGNNGYGQLDVPSGQTWARVAAGHEHTCALTTGGRAYCWGRNTDGQAPPGPIGAAGTWTDLVAGDAHTCGVRADGIDCWGSNRHGEAGGTPRAPTTVGPVAGIGAVASASSEGSFTCVVSTDGEAHCWGANGTGTRGDGTSSSSFVPTPSGAAGTQWLQVAPGQSHVCAIRADHTLWCWGDNAQGQLALPGVVLALTPQQVMIGDESWALVDTRERTSCAISVDHDLYCWGESAAGEAGVVAATTGPVQILDGVDWARVSSGYQTTCAIAVDGRRACFGRNHSGEKGRGDYADVREPEVFAGDAASWSSLSMAQYVGCAVSDNSDGHRLFCWGTESAEELGNGPQDPGEPGYSAAAPALSNANTGWTDVDMGWNHACGVRQGALLCWGNEFDNGFAQLVATPTQHGTASSWIDVVAGVTGTCALDATGDLYCWGDAAGYGEDTGPFDPNDHFPDAPLAGGDWASFGLGEGHTCAIKQDGSLWCWGSGTNGELGNGTGPNPIPSTVIRE